MSQNGWQTWQAPVGTTDPNRLIPEDSTDATVNGALAQQNPDSAKLAGSLNTGKPIQVEETKPIESVNDSANPPAPALATAAPKTKSGSTRFIVIAVLGVAVLGYRKVRKANASPYPPKPNFL